MKHYYMAFTAAILLLFLNTRQAHAGGIVVQIMQQGNATCNGSCDGFATAVASGGMAPYTYSWSPSGGNQSTATGLCAGTYTVTAMDAMSQTGTVTVTIVQPTPVVVSTSAQQASSSSTCDGSATAVVTGGTPGYTFMWTPGSQTTPTINNLCVGSYTVCVTDVNGCSSCQTVTITAPSGGLTVQIMQQVNASCNNSCNGAATAVASNGTPPYTYSWAPSGGNQQTASGLCAGTYTVTATDSLMQTATVTVTITQPQPVSVVATAGTSTTCACFTMGTANATGGNGGPYTYTWNPGNLTGATVSTLCPASVYTITATDPNGCTGTFILTTSPPMQQGPSVTTNSTQASSQSTCDGTATATVTGGTAPYTYLWSPGGQTTATINNLCPGTYTVCVTDASGCTSCQSITVTFLTGTNDPAGVNGVMNLFPNPASGMVEIQLPVTANQMQLEIFDAFGRIVFAEQLNTSTKIDVGNWTNGVYIVRLVSAEGTATRKLLISH
ncbi:MAG: hypothetical protein FD123_2701 [Bacteroidetes bacterium]|nr:MAG: hypothetical protein FD123_2701 [Bacteroidota bacterium]